MGFVEFDISFSKNLGPQMSVGEDAMEIMHSIIDDHSSNEIINLEDDLFGI